MLRPEPNGRKPLGTGIVDAVRSLAGNGAVRENATRFVVRGLNSESRRVEELDLLQDKLISR